MNLSITGRHLEVTPAINEYVKTKMARVARHFDNVIDTQVMLSVERLKHTAEVTMRLPGKDLHCEASDENLYAAIDLLADKIDRQVIKYKDKVQNHAHEPLKRQEIAVDQ
ncbi:MULTISPECIES: ribosome hibernation-promoting factor, HPF/YfiA family [Alcaligenaceae]|jgi:putative sigma-54 modulation protein|uniref:Ribosome hibernation promoting factor n=1 Tax=Neopusillimonas maritima TaxID=2026239 RepID=A0A3A1YXH1_9BURK|nr:MULTISPECIES: ribosome-associated translation inhibitor RaiA [Alcaligenaceae]MAL02130.1 ribosomal subunit interface protein [Alcaligenaceae bacterium]QIM48670.1 ribosome-associated translation inhibitor RaiA [Pusillimonas sp. DMV24BSW_D]RII84530.1 ribosomal subunit interface protein [Neopusillimonas maritima]RIY42245.1 ribosomal subunit interface protein [Neopusillimonas maritima]|tara:strand:+ start:5318 stop:5647 length:330 start_codon:yes stop_codon:yes gene_type:complete